MKYGGSTYTVTAKIDDTNYVTTGANSAEFVIEKAPITAPTIASKPYTGGLLCEPRRSGNNAV